MRKIAIFALVMALPAPALALRVDNCDNEPQIVQVHYSGSTTTLELAPGQGRYVGGIPLELQAGKDLHRMIDYDDEWCVWGKDDIQLQRKNSQRRGG